MEAILHYAFMDESGTVGATGTHFLVVAVLATPTPHAIERPIRRAMKKFGPNLNSGEIKAADFDEPIIMRLLAEIAEQDIALVATIVDQRAIRIPPKDAEHIYRKSVAWTIRALAEKYPHLDLSIDRRYTNAHMRRLLEKAIRDEVANLPYQNIVIQQENSALSKALQAVDAIAWALFEKYERGDPRFYELIAAKILKRNARQAIGLALKRKSPINRNKFRPTRDFHERLTLSSDFSLLWVPVPFQEQLGHSTSDQSHQALRYRSKLFYCFQFRFARYVEIHFDLQGIHNETIHPQRSRL